MKPDLTQSAKELSFLLAETQKHACGFSGDAGEITYLFFAAELSITDISEICELPASEVNRTISDFLVDFFTKSKRFQEFLSRPPATDERVVEIRIEQDTAIAELKESKADSLIASCKIPDSLGDRVRDVVGTAIRIGMPAASTNFTPESVSKMGIAAKICKTRSAEIFVDLKERNFFLGHLKEAADEAIMLEVDQVAKTYSDGTVLIERDMEKIMVDFHIALLEKTPSEEIPEYEITFHNLPNWATPVLFSFVGPNDMGVTKEYQLPLKLCKGRFCFKVENEEQENAFSDKIGKPALGFLFTEEQYE